MYSDLGLRPFAPSPLIVAALCVFAAVAGSGCASLVNNNRSAAPSSDPPPSVTPPPAPQSAVSVAAAPTASALQPGQTQSFVATVTNDPQSKGVAWSFSGCNPGACGQLSATTSASGSPITYTAPAAVSAAASITLTASSVFDSAKTASASISIAPSPLAISVIISPQAQALQISQTQTFTATVQNDAQNKGVTWSLSGAQCANTACGTLSGVTSASGAAITYTAPAHAPNPPIFTLLATSVADSTASANAPITINAPGPNISVTVSPTAQTVPVNRSQAFTATVQNDAQNKGVTWSLSGAQCANAVCGTLSSTTSASGASITYTAPAQVPNPPTITLLATSVADSSDSASAPITISAPSSPISVTVTPASQTVPVNRSQNFSATVQNDAQNKGVDWTLSGAGCSGPACGTLSAASSSSGASITYTAPANPPNPATVTLTAASVSDSKSSAAANISISFPVPQVSVLTQHYDISRSGANLSETILTPANVNSQSFGKLFSYAVDGYVYAQPLYVPGLTMATGTPQAGTIHNVVFVATEHDSVYAFDADTNSSAGNAAPLWHASLLDAAHGAARGARPMLSSDNRTKDIVPFIGITGTPVIDPATGTLYVVGKTKENDAYIARLHALDITSGAEKFGGPVQLTASVPGNGSGSVSGTLSFDPYYENQRAGLLLLNGIVYMAFGSHGDYGPWHGWILAYDASTLRQTGAWCTTPNSLRGGIWGAGVGLAGEIPDPANHPFGRMFTSSGNGTFDAIAPNYDNSMGYGDSIIRLDLTNGAPSMTTNGKTVGDVFAPFNQSALDASDQDQGSGAPILLPDAVSGGQHLLVQAGKTGRIYVIDRGNLGGYHPENTIDPQQKAGVHGLFGAPAYWNGHLYFWGYKDNLRDFHFANGVMSPEADAVSNEFSTFPPSLPAVSANGNRNGIVWNILSDNFASQGSESLQAHDAANVSRLLYSSDENLARDNPGPAVKYIVPTVANGKVYVGSGNQVSVFGLLNNSRQASAPAINPASQSFGSSLTVTISDSTAGAVIHFTTDGSTPTSASPTYSGPLTVTKATTVNAIALASGYLPSNVSTATYTPSSQTAMPTFSPAPGAYASGQQVSISTSTSGATIYYTIDGSTPSSASTPYTGPITFSRSATLKAIAIAPKLADSPVASGLYTIQ